MLSGSLAILFFLVVGALSLAVTVFWIWMLIDCLTQETDENHNRLIWSLVIMFTGVGAPIYFFTRRADRKRQESAPDLPASSSRGRRTSRPHAAAGGAVLGEGAAWAAIVSDTNPAPYDRRHDDAPDHGSDGGGFDGGGFDGGGFDGGGADGGF